MTRMSQEMYIGMDVHQATISVAVMDAQGKLIMECLLETPESHCGATNRQGYWHRRSDEVVDARFIAPPT